MKLTRSPLLLTILTFFVGCLTVWLIGLMLDSKEVSSSSSRSLNDFQTFTPVEPIPIATPESQPRFTETYRACYPGVSQGYVTNNGQQLFQSSRLFETPKKARAELKKKIKEAVRIVEHIPNYKGFDKVVVERIIVINPPDKNGKETASILWYGGGQFIHSINAPSLDLAFEFESFFEQKRLTDLKGVMNPPFFDKCKTEEECLENAPF